MATSTKMGLPQVVPICFAFDGRCIYTAIDNKPKHAETMKLRRVVNIMNNPDVSIIVDRYDEDWRKLRFVMVRGRARILRSGREHDRGLCLLRKKYCQYHDMNLDSRPIIRIIPTKITSWQYW
jgi:PPOX class probable F420-dependent enzyme